MKLRIQVELTVDANSDDTHEIKAAVLDTLMGTQYRVWAAGQPNLEVFIEQSDEITVKEIR